MTTIIVGGLRARLIKDSLYHCVHDSLAALGWFDPGRRHTPLTFTGTTIDRNVSIPFNTLALSDESLHESEEELGSQFALHRTVYYCDFYAENAEIAKHVINDVRDILGGRMSTIGRDDPHVDVYDYSQATPPHIFSVQIENLVVDRAHDFPKPWLVHWYALRFDVLDYYGNEITA